MIKRNIITNLVLTKDLIKLVIIEKLATSNVEIFTAETNVENHAIFIKESLAKVKDVVGAKINNVTIIVEPFKDVEEKIQIVREIIRIPSQIVQRQDIENLLALTKEKYESKTRKVILVQPISFEVHDVITKTYNRAPIHKKGQALTMTLAITTISDISLMFINKIADFHHLNVTQILLTPQVLSFNDISEHAQNFGAALLSIEKNYSYLTIVRNYAVVALLKLNNVGHNNLLQKIAKEFECNEIEAEKLIIVYGNIDNNVSPRIININNYVVEKNHLKTNLKLNDIIKQFINNLLLVTRSYLKQKLDYKYENFPIVINGQISKVQGLEQFSRLLLQTELVSTFLPLTYIEKNNNNIYGLGVIKFMNKSDEVGGIHYDTIIETNPETVTNINPKFNKSENLLTRILYKIGGINGT